jgi:hypothetical protein
MKATVLFFALNFNVFFYANAQCSLCTKTASQLGEKPAKSLNKGIIYLALAPLSIMGIIWVLYKKYGAGQLDAKD